MPPILQTAALTMPGDRLVVTTLRGQPSVAKQLEALGTVNLRELSHPPDAAWPTISHQKKRYILEDWLRRKRSRAPWITEHGNFLVELTNSYTTGESQWCCKHCNAMYSIAATTNASKHLRAEHGFLDPATSEHPSKRPKTSSMPSVLEQQQAAALVRPVLKPTADTIENLLLSWIVTDDLSFTTLENPSLRKLFHIFNPTLAPIVSVSDDTLQRSTARWYNTEKMALQKTLASTPFKIHLSFDAWTSPNTITLLAVVAHFIDDKFNLQAKLLSMVPLKGSHSGETQSVAILD
ncbi:hypothetical protein C8A05DRAFT_37540, partial [Staphylotrichum tortipilum]